MREKLNENQTAQIALVAVLVIVVGFFFYKSFAGGSESSASTESSATVSEGSTPTAATSASSAPSGGKLPKAVESAYESGDTVVLLVHHEGGIDDRKVKEAAGVLEGMAGVAYFPVSVDKIAEYAPITGPLGVSSAPALIVVRRRGLNAGGDAQATVTYGFQTASDIRQAVVEADYKGPHLTYAPR
jgi:hypothetical protein